MNIQDLKVSKFLKKEDVGPGALVTIRQITSENTAKEGAEPEMKFCLHFDEFEKPMVLNSTNGQLIGQITGITDNIETGWIGKAIVLYSDPSVSFGGKLVGGIRVRAPRATAAQRPAAARPAPVAAQAPAQAQTFADDGSPVPSDDGLPF